MNVPGSGHRSVTTNTSINLANLKLNRAHPLVCVSDITLRNVKSHRSLLSLGQNSAAICHDDLRCRPAMALQCMLYQLGHFTGWRSATRPLYKAWCCQLSWCQWALLVRQRALTKELCMQV